MVSGGMWFGISEDLRLRLRLQERVEQGAPGVSAAASGPAAGV